jgi:hypothetical protein
VAQWVVSKLNFAWSNSSRREFRSLSLWQKNHSSHTALEVGWAIRLWKWGKMPILFHAGVPDAVAYLLHGGAIPWRRSRIGFFRVLDFRPPPTSRDAVPGTSTTSLRLRHSGTRIDGRCGRTSRYPDPDLTVLATRFREPRQHHLAADAAGRGWMADVDGQVATRIRTWRYQGDVCSGRLTGLPFMLCVSYILCFPSAGLINFLCINYNLRLYLLI